MLKYEVPVVYDIIIGMTPDVPFPEPSLLVIKTVCGASKDSSFRKPKYLKYLREYELYGIYCHRPKLLTAKNIIYYEQLRSKSLKNYIQTKNLHNVLKS